jgi:hypothetical protein
MTLADTGLIEHESDVIRIPRHPEFGGAASRKVNSGDLLRQQHNNRQDESILCLQPFRHCSCCLLAIDPSSLPYCRYHSIGKVILQGIGSTRIPFAVQGVVCFSGYASPRPRRLSRFTHQRRLSHILFCLCAIPFTTDFLPL